MRSAHLSAIRVLLDHCFLEAPARTTNSLTLDAAATLRRNKVESRQHGELWRAFESSVTAIASAMRIQGVCTTRPTTQKFPNSSNSMQPRLKLSHLRSLNIFLKYSKVRNTISSPQEAYRRRCLVRSHSAREGPRLEGSFWNLELCLNLGSFWCQMCKILTSCCSTLTYFPHEWRPQRLMMMMPSGHGVS